jgi:hypothetical protein
MVAIITAQDVITPAMFFIPEILKKYSTIRITATTAVIPRGI